MFVKPGREGLKVAIPGQPGVYVPETGMQVHETVYWRRRLRDGDVVKSEPPKATRPSRDRGASTKD